MFVEVTSDDGQVYEFNGVDEVSYIPNEDSRSDSFVRLNYIVPKNPTEREKFDTKNGKPVDGNEQNNDVTLRRFPDEGIKRLTIKNAFITTVAPSDISEAFSN